MSNVIVVIDNSQSLYINWLYICSVKFVFAISVMLAMLVQTFSKAFVMADFYWNQDQIAEQLCENKDKPELKCKGACALKKELEKEERNEVSQYIQAIKLFLNPEPFRLNPPAESIFQVYGIVPDDGRLFSWHASLLRPPAC